MAYNASQTRTWGTTTPASGNYLEAEFNRVYANTAYFKDSPQVNAIELLTGNLKVSSGKGIDFSGTADAAGMTAELLADYEEGTWTPSVGGNATYTGSPAGTYTKIGRLVHVTGIMQINAVGTGSTTTISGLPYAVASPGYGLGSVGYWTGLATNAYSLTPTPASSSITFSGQTALDNAVNDSLAIFGNGAYVIFNLCYRV